MKEGLYIKPITDVEASVLRNNNYGWAVISGGGTYHQKMLVEDRFVLKFLKEYHNSIRVKTVTS